jgi:starch-binding outer membrane protein, SusD/RagB family
VISPREPPTRTVPLPPPTRSWLTWLLALATISCSSLDVVNPNDPDRDRALATARDLESLIAGTFNVFFTGIHNTSHVVNLFPIYGSEMTGVPVSGGGWSESQEPRTSYDNSPGISADSGPWGPRLLWSSLSQVASNSNDGMRGIRERGIRLSEGEIDVTPRARAFALLMRGWAWGYLAMMYDRAVLVPEWEPVPDDAIEQAIRSIRPWEVVRDSALASLEEAISISGRHTFVVPAVSESRRWFGSPRPLREADLARLASTIAARVLVLSARTPEQRSGLDWNRVLAYTEAGLTTDFEVLLEPGFRTSLLYARAQTNSAGCANCFRLDNRLIGAADVSGSFQEWLAKPVSSRTRFDIVTPDRRITGPTPRSNGAYTFYRADDNGFPPGRGLYFRSAYQWGRHQHRGYSSTTGTVLVATVDENNLLRAEALLRLGDRTGAAALVNVTRTRSRTLPDGSIHPGLPPVTSAGVTPAADCVPRTDRGACGDLLAALRYERMIELVGIDAIRGYADSRGFGLLPDGSWLQLPIPGNELELLGFPIYTFGGFGSQWGAVYAPATAP